MLLKSILLITNRDNNTTHYNNNNNHSSNTNTNNTNTDHNNNNTYNKTNHTIHIILIMISAGPCRASPRPPPERAPR